MSVQVLYAYPYIDLVEVLFYTYVEYSTHMDLVSVLRLKSLRLCRRGELICVEVERLN